MKVSGLLDSVWSQAEEEVTEEVTEEVMPADMEVGPQVQGEGTLEQATVPPGLEKVPTEKVKANLEKEE